MFDIQRADNGHILLFGRLHAAEVEKLREALQDVAEPYTLDFSNLEYISSAGLGILLATQKRLGKSGHGLRIINLKERIRYLFRVAGFDVIFEID